MRTKTLLLIGILIMAAGLVGWAGVAFAQSQTTNPTTETTPPRTINVTASGKVLLTPDIAYVNIGVHTEDKAAAEAVAANNELAKKVIEAIKATGVDGKDIQTMNFSIYPQQVVDSEGKPTGELRFIVDNTVYVTVRKLDALGGMLDAAIKAGANTVNGISFDVVDKTSALSEARKQAVANAQAQASELAQAAGVSLGAVQTINAYGSATPVPVYEAKAASFMANSTVPVETGQMTITVEVNIVYAIQ